MKSKLKPTRPLKLTGAALVDRNDRITKRDRQRCAKCGVVIWSGGSRHHRKFKSRRGGDEISNGVLLCGSGTTGCHGWVHSNPVSARMIGLALESWEDPLIVPVIHAALGGVAVWFDNDGNASTTPPKLAA